MSVHNKTILLLAKKIGLADEPKVLRKAQEYVRLLESKSTAGVALNEVSKAVICLELAANNLSIAVDTVSAIKFSSMKKPSYLNSKMICEKLLGLKEDVTVKSICLKNQCLSVQSLAETIMTKYKENCYQEIDMDQPQYSCMAVYQACRISKIKLSKPKIQVMSRAKPAIWNRLDIEWTAFVDQHFQNNNKNVKMPHQEDLHKSNGDKLTSTKEDDDILKIEDYETWRERILKEAQLALTQVNNCQKSPKKQVVNGILSPRKQDINGVLSPRKREYAQIHLSPRKSPRKLELPGSTTPNKEKKNKEVFTPLQLIVRIPKLNI